MAHLFRPFFTPKPTEEGNGLGLYLTKALAAKNQGSLNVSSFKDCGTTYRLTFPRAAQKFARNNQ